jgi:hypothetical protein
MTKYLKAVVAFLAPTITQLTVQLQQPKPDWHAMGVTAIVGVFTALVVWAVPNTTPQQPNPPAS